MFKALTFIAAGAGILYGGYWVVGSRAVESAALSAVDGLRADGWDITYDDLSTRGFPNRFDTVATQPRVVAPGGDLGWRAEAFGLYALSYRPNSVIALFPADQTISARGQTVDVRTTAMKASGRIVPTLDLPLDNVTLESGPLSAKSSAGWEVVADHALAAFRASGPADNAYDLYLTVDAPGLDGVTAPGLAVDLVAVDAQATLDAPLDRHTTRPALVALTLRDARLEIGAASVVATGALDFDAEGLGTGRIDIVATGWETLVDTFVAAGLVDADRAGTVRLALGALSAGGPDITAPITVTDGVARLGFFPIGTVAVPPRPPRP